MKKLLIKNLAFIVLSFFISVNIAQADDANIPKKIRHVSTKRIAYNQVKVMWRLAQSSGYKYYLRLQDRQGNILQKFRTNKKEQVISDLEPTTNYYIKIRAASGNKNRGKWSIAKMFKTGKKPPETVTAIFGGDVMMSRYVGRITAQNNDWDLPFHNIADEFKQNDLTFINLEAPFKETGPYYVGDDSMVFKTDPKMMEGLKSADINVASLANNHIYNAGSDSVEYTKNYLNDNDIEYCFDVPVIMEIKDIKFGFLCYGYDLNLDTNLLISQINEIKDQTDVIVVSMHNGSEYTESISSSQSNFAHTAIDSGADLVIGHHPHVVQRLEEYHGKYIFYSLGNLVFDQSWSWPTQLGAAIKITWIDKTIKKIEFKPIKIDGDFQPRFMDFEEGKEVLGRLQVDNYEILK